MSNSFASDAAPSPTSVFGGAASIPSFLKVWLSFFHKCFENSKFTPILLIYNSLPSHTYLSVHLSYTTTAFPTSWFMSLLIPDTVLTLLASQAHDGRGVFFVLLNLFCMCMFLISLRRRMGLGFLTPERDHCQFCHWSSKYFWSNYLTCKVMLHLER